MLRFAHRRLIVFFVLLCQVLAGAIVHVPMAQAAPTAPTAVTSGKHCHDSAPSDTRHVDGVAGTTAAHTSSHSGGGASDPSHHCKSGVCGCVCASAPAALPAMSGAGLPVLSHPPLLVLYQAHAAPVRAAVFFRPPIV